MLKQASRRIGERVRVLAVTLLSSVLLVPLGPGAPAAAAELSTTYQAGDLLALTGSPHLYLVSGGRVRWLADTRAAAQQPINWGRRHEVTVTQLQAWRTDGLLGDPFLSLPLVRESPPPAGQACCPIHLVKQETHEPAPRLFWIRDIQDVELFGISAQNYGQFVAEAAAFQAQYGHAVRALARADLAPLGSPATVATTAAAATGAAAGRARLGTWPPQPGSHIQFTLPAQWQRYTGARSFGLAGQTLVTSLYRPIGGTDVPIIWVTALPGADYPQDTATTLLRRALVFDEQDSSGLLDVTSRARRTVDELVAGARTQTVAGVPALAVDYEWTWRSARVWQTVLVLQHGNVFWNLQYWALTPQEFRDRTVDFDQFLASLRFGY